MCGQRVFNARGKVTRPADSTAILVLGSHVSNRSPSAQLSNNTFLQSNRTYSRANASGLLSWISGRSRGCRLSTDVDCRARIPRSHPGAGSSKAPGAVVIVLNKITKTYPTLNGVNVVLKGISAVFP